MTKKDAIKVAATYFGNYPGVNTFHVTTDKQVFESATDAANHAKSFSKKENNVFFTVTREEEIEAREVEKAALIVSVPDGATIMSPTPETLNVKSESDISSENLAKINDDASDAETTDADALKKSPEAEEEIDRLQEAKDIDAAANTVETPDATGGSKAQHYGKEKAVKKATSNANARSGGNARKGN